MHNELKRVSEEFKRVSEELKHKANQAEDAILQIINMRSK